MEEQKDIQSSGKMKEMCYFFSTFTDPSLERLYQSFSVKQKRAGLECFLITAILFDIYMIVVPSGQDILIYSFMSAFLVTNLALLLWCKRGFESKLLWSAIPHVSWHVANAQVLAALFLKKNEVTSRDSLGWVLLLDYLIFVTLPLRLRYCVILSVGTCASYIAAVIGLSKSDLHFTQQHVSNCILLLTSNILGLTSYLVEDKQQRRAFLETRQSLEVKLVIEEQSTEQENLLLSVLPEHVAVEMRQDLDQADSQFKKIYMNRHENVSILYADIVGFTAISSTYSAQELVKMLNELFARFDKLAEQTANSPVDMRVGIHTGAVLAGVLGQRQWQFDVYSKDVELANKMESSGLAGRVHISATTLSFLSGEFEVEAAFGEKRDEALRIAGLKTYFIVKVLKPFEPEKSEVQNGGGIIPEDDSCVIADITADVKEVEANGTNTNRCRTDSADFKIRLRKELVNRDGHKELSKNTKFLSLAFTDPQKEKSYHQHIETFSSFFLLMFLIVKIAIGSTIFIVLPSDLTIDISYCTENVVFVVLVIIAIAEEFPALSRCWKAFKESMTIRRVLSTLCVILLGSANIVDTISCVQIQKAPENCSTTEDINAACLYPSYFSYFAVLILVASSLPACLSYLWKSLLMILIACAQCLVNIVILGPALDCEESRKHWTRVRYPKFFKYKMEQVARVLFLWRSEVEEQRDCAEDMRRRNEALVYNILPPHVAAHFMGNKNRNHDELYSQSYAEVGVLFASMPNFSDFYSEETVNNQGLECLRFLNEVISDFDALLEWPQFQDVIKIKTIGSTYMAASGLNPTRQVKVTEETCEILQCFGYQFEQRGLVAVKGKGQLMTYYLLGKAGKITPPTAPVSPINGLSTMETLNEEDESHDSPTSKSDDKTVIECSDSKMDDDVFADNDALSTTDQPFLNKEVEPKDSTENTLLLSHCDA
ncbi:unnamed protein product [Brassicogethes aeneus]|uniref:adenylate cyclase n=1 Tax=Brassicogethes aeneus TaxID=1431903 RepID=A0A9P0B8M7_BRAAE|nr:unnamed protein product [Brassicogethes aeneus]